MELDVNQLIGRRVYNNSAGVEVVVTLGMPNLTPQGKGIDGFYSCPFQITGIGFDNVMISSGVDELEAVFRALSMIAVRLENCPDGSQGKLNWIGSLDSDLLGFNDFA